MNDDTLENLLPNGDIYYPLTPETIKILYKAKLTAAEWRMWSFLSLFDSWGNTYKDMPDALTIMKIVGISKSTYFAAIAKFQKFELFDFQSKGISIRNLRGVEKVRTVQSSSSPKSRSDSPKSGNDSPKSRNDSPKSRNDSPKSRNEGRKTGKNSKNSESETSKPLSNQVSSDSQNKLDSYQNFINSLSEAEREKFENFCWSEVANFPRPVINLGDYLAAPDASGQPRYLDFWQRFEKSSLGVQARSHRIAQELTQEVYEELEGQLIDDGYDMYRFGQRAERSSPEWHLRLKFLEIWEERNPNYVVS